jgi:hypothetical protein
MTAHPRVGVEPGERRGLGHTDIAAPERLQRGRQLLTEAGEARIGARLSR